MSCTTEALRSRGSRRRDEATRQSGVDPGPPLTSPRAVTVFCRAEVPADAVPHNMEPHKCEGWEWVSAQVQGMGRGCLISHECGCSGLGVPRACFCPPPWLPIVLANTLPL